MLAIPLLILPSLLWTSATPAEALFFLELKDGLSNNYHFLTFKIFSLIGAHTNYVSLWPLRFFSGFCAVVVLISIYWGAKRIYNASTGFWAAMVLLTLPLFARFAVEALPYMWHTALVSMIAVLWFTGKFSWRRNLALGFVVVVTVLSVGISIIYFLLALVIYDFVTLKNKKQDSFKHRLILSAGLLLGAVGVLLAEAYFMNESIFKHFLWMGPVLGDVVLLSPKAVLKKALNFLFENFSIWFIVAAALSLWMLIVKRYRQPAWQLKHLLIWLIVLLLLIFITSNAQISMLLCALPPLAIIIGSQLVHYATCRNAQPQARHMLTANALMLKMLLVSWGLIICVLGIYLFFNLETAWHRELYFQTIQLGFLIAIGAFIIILGVSSFWLVSRAYAFWGFIIVVLLSFGFIGNYVILPARDILHTSYFFSHNLKNVDPQVVSTGITFSLPPTTSSLETQARYFLYADYPVTFMTLTPSSFAADNVAELPEILVAEFDTANDWVPAAYAAGYRPVYWEDVAGTLVMVLRKVPEATESRILLAGDNAEALFASGFCWSTGYLIPYSGQTAVEKQLTQIMIWPAENLNIFCANLGDGLRNPYIYRWLTTAGRAAPDGASTGLALNYQEAYINKHWPYSITFQKWALANVVESVQPSFILFNGLNPQHGRSRRVLGQILTAMETTQRQTTLVPLAQEIAFEVSEKGVFLRFYRNEKAQLTLEIRPRRQPQ